MNPILTVSSEPEPAAEKVVGDGLNAFNDAKVGYADRLALHVIVRDSDSGKIVGGISGRTSLGLMFIDLVYLPAALRGHDIGTRMMAMARKKPAGEVAELVCFTRSAFRRQASISVWDGAFLEKSLATRQAPVGFF
jgi:hypothetical protein